MAAQLKRRKFTVEEFYRMVPACILGEDTLEELIDGDVMVRALKTRRHSSAISRLYRMLILNETLEFTPSVQCPIRLDRYKEPVTDIALVKRDFDSEGHPGPLDVLLLIEMADTAAEVEYDRDMKLPTYARFGIEELWLIKLQTGVVEVHRKPVGDNYQVVAHFGRGEILTIQELPDIPLAVNDLLA